MAILPYPFKSGSRTVVPGAADTEGDTDSLHAAFENYVSDCARLNLHSQNAREMAEALFDRETTYQKLADFIIETVPPHIESRGDAHQS